MIRCDSLDDLLDAAAVLAEQPVPGGGGVGIVCNARGPGVVCADACTDAGLTVASLSDATQAALRSFLAPTSVVAGPVQLSRPSRRTGSAPRSSTSPPTPPWTP